MDAFARFNVPYVRGKSLCLQLTASQCSLSLGWQNPPISRKTFSAYRLDWLSTPMLRQTGTKAVYLTCSTKSFPALLTTWHQLSLTSPGPSQKRISPAKNLSKVLTLLLQCMHVFYQTLYRGHCASLFVRGCAVSSGHVDRIFHLLLKIEDGEATMHKVK